MRPAGCDQGGKSITVAATDTAQDHVKSAQRLLKRASYGAGALVLLFVIGAAAIPLSPARMWLTGYIAIHQDLRLLALSFVILVAALLAAGRRTRPLVVSRTAVAALAMATVGFCYAGRRLVLQDFDLVRDEQMVAFDAFVYRHGHLVWPIPTEWQADASALNLTFMYAVEHPVAWISSYLPGNALLHAAVGLFVDPGLTNPILAGLCVPLVWSLARRLWPEDPDNPAIALLILVVSGQFLITAMTTWAMTAHLFFNLVWLRLFLCNRRSTDFAALAIGAFATGLHQPLFHPMFVVPFGLLVLGRREWLRVGIFGLGYILIGLFWLTWPHWIEGLVSGGAPALAGNGTDYVERAQGTISENAANLALMGGNLLRFVVWQNLAVLPLLGAAVPMVRRDPFIAALAGGIVLPVIAMTFLLPWQGYGFGYRYLHPVLGNVALLSVYGWQNLTALRQALRPAILALTAGGLFLVLPVQLMFAHGFVFANAEASRSIDASGADFFIVNPADGFGYANIVFNLPDLSNRPIRLQSDKIRDHKGLARRVCHVGVTVAFPGNAFFQENSDYFGMEPLDRAAQTAVKFRGFYEQAGCTIIVLGR